MLKKKEYNSKRLAANMLAMSHLTYISSVMYTHEWVISKYNKRIENYVWQNIPAKVKYTTMIDNVGNGGKRLQDISTK